MFFEIILFIFVLFFVIYLPGIYLLRLSRFSIEDKLISLPLALCVGMTCFILGTYGLSFAGVAYLYHIFLVPIWFKELKIIYQSYKKKRKKSLDPYLLGILFIGSFWMSFLMWNSGQKVNGELHFYGVNAVDAIWHLSLIGNLSSHIPPTHPGLAGEVLKGYNFFYDLFLAQLHVFYSFSPMDLFFRLMPFFLSFLYGLSGFALASFLKLKRLTQYIFVFLLYFGFGFEQWVSLIFNVFFNPGIVHTAANIVDPSVILSITFLFCIVILFLSAKTKTQLLFAALLLGILPMIKIYTAVMCFAGIGIIALIHLAKRDFKYILTLFGASVLAAVLYLPINFGAGSLIFAPFLLYRHFMEGAKFFTEYQWALKYQTYTVDNNYIRIIQLYVIALAFFFIPSLGVRLMSLTLLPKLFKKEFYTDAHIFFIVSIVTGFIIPTLFIQSIAVFVVLQFLWIAFILLLLPTAISLTKGIDLKNKLKVVLLVIILFVFAIPDIVHLYHHYTTEPYKVAKDFTITLNRINKITPVNDSLLVVNAVTTKEFPDGKLVYATPIVSAVTLRNVYYEPEVLEFYKLEKLQSERSKNVLEVHKALNSCDNSMIKEKVKKIQQEEKSVKYLLTLRKYDCIQDSEWLKKLISEGMYSFYRIE